MDTKHNTNKISSTLVDQSKSHLKKQLPLLPLTNTFLLFLNLDLCFENLGHKASFGLAKGQRSLLRPWSLSDGPSKVCWKAPKIRLVPYETINMRKYNWLKTTFAAKWLKHKYIYKLTKPHLDLKTFPNEVLVSQSHTDPRRQEDSDCPSVCKVRHSEKMNIPQSRSQYHLFSFASDPRKISHLISGVWEMMATSSPALRARSSPSL